MNGWEWDEWEGAGLWCRGRMGDKSAGMVDMSEEEEDDDGGDEGV